MKTIPLLTLVLSLSLSPFAAQAAYDKDYIGQMDEMRTVYEDTFVKIARKHNLGYVEMRAANPLVDPWLPGDGTPLILPKQNLLPDAPRKGVVINLPEMRLYNYPADGGAPTSHPIGIGRDGLSTPTGTTSIVNKVVGPTWRPTARMRKENPDLPAAVPPGPKNPLGSHALYLGWPEYRIHGTNKPYGIGRRTSSGCIRMYPEDIIAVYNEVPVSAQVTVVDQPVKAGWIEDGFYIEAVPTIEESEILESNGQIEGSRLSEKDVAEIIAKAGPIAEKLDWPTIREAVKKRSGYPIRVGNRDGSPVAQAAAIKAPVPVQGKNPAATHVSVKDENGGMIQVRSN